MYNSSKALGKYGIASPEYDEVTNPVKSFDYEFVSVLGTDVKGKQYLETNGKYYLVDIGLRYFLLGTKYVDFGHILGNQHK